MSATIPCQCCNDTGKVGEDDCVRVCPVCDGEPIDYEGVKLYAEQIDFYSNRAWKAEALLRECEVALRLLIPACDQARASGQGEMVLAVARGALAKLEGRP